MPDITRAIIVSMLWFFERADEVLELETRYDNATSEYILERRAPGAPREIERFSNAVAFRARLQALEQSLTGQHWRPKESPLVLSDGWPDITPRK